jgi:hypothetical protein
MKERSGGAGDLSPISFSLFLFVFRWKSLDCQALSVARLGQVRDPTCTFWPFSFFLSFPSLIFFPHFFPFFFDSLSLYLLFTYFLSLFFFSLFSFH